MLLKPDLWDERLFASEMTFFVSCVICFVFLKDRRKEPEVARDDRLQMPETGRRFFRATTLSKRELIVGR
jgi:hypothetical protein